MYHQPPPQTRSSPPVTSTAREMLQAQKNLGGLPPSQNNSNRPRPKMAQLASAALPVQAQ